MLDARGHEQQVAGAEAAPPRAEDEVALASHDDVHLVPAMQRLGIDATRGEQLDAQRAVPVGDDERQAVRRGEPPRPLREAAVEPVHRGWPRESPTTDRLTLVP